MSYLLIGWLAWVSAACSVPGQQPALHDFGGTVPGSVHQGKALINVIAPTWLWDNRIRYRLLFTSPTQIRYYGLDRWIAAPPELFEHLLRFSGKTVEHNLLIQLNDFEQQFDSPNQARVVLRFSVEAYSAKDKQKLGAQEFYLEQVAKTPDAAGAINGFTDLVQQAGVKIQNWLTGLSAAP